jgi:ribosomal protein S9
MASQYYEGVGRRKESSARVRLVSGSGVFKSMKSRWKISSPVMEM